MIQKPARNRLTILMYLLLFCSTALYSATFEFAPLEKQIRSANLIIYGSLLSKRTAEIDKVYKGYALENGNRVEFDISEKDIETFFKFKVIEVLMGVYSEKTIEVAVAGGCVKDKCVDYSHSYSFNEGEEGVLLLNKHSDGSYFALNASYDVFNVDENKNLIRKADSIVYSEIWKSLNKASTDKDVNMEMLIHKIKEVSDEN